MVPLLFDGIVIRELPENWPESVRVPPLVSATVKPLLSVILPENVLLFWVESASVPEEPALTVMLLATVAPLPV